MSMFPSMFPNETLHRWGGAAFVLGNLLFITNKLDEMSRMGLDLRLGQPLRLEAAA